MAATSEADNEEGRPDAHGSRADRSFPGRFLLAVGLGVFLLYAAGLNSKWRFQRDSAIYLALGRSLAEGRGYVYNGRPHSRYAPGLPAALAVIGKAAGIPQTPQDSFLPMNLMEMLAGAGCIALVVLVARELDLTRSEAVALVLLCAFSRTLYYYSAQIMTEAPFTLLALGALWCGLRMLRTTGRASWAWCAGAGLFALLASSIRPVGPLLLPALAAGLWLRRGALHRWAPNAGKTLLILALVVLPMIGWITYTEADQAEERVGYARNSLRWFRAERLQRVGVNAFTRIHEHSEGFSDAITGSNLGSPVGLLLLGILGVGLVEGLLRGERVLTAFALLAIGAIIAGGWIVRRRYLLPALPVLFYWLVLGGSRVGRWLRRWESFWSRRRLRYLGWTCLALVLTVNAVRIGKVIYQNRSPRFYELAKGGIMADYAPLTAWLRHHADAGQSVLADEHSTVHYFSRMHTVPFPYRARRRGAQNLRDLLLSEKVVYVVRDGRDEETAAAVDRLTQGAPDAFHTVFAVGKVRLFRVDRGRLGEADLTRSAGRNPWNRFRHPSAVSSAGRGFLRRGAGLPTPCRLPDRTCRPRIRQ